MVMRSNSLSLRLTVSAAVIALVLLALASIVLSTLFQQALERNFDERLRAVLDSLSANVFPGDDGSPQLTGNMADTRFTLPESGWNWQVLPPKVTQKPLLSPSLLAKPIGFDAKLLGTRDADRITSFAFKNPAKQQLRAMEQRIKFKDIDGEYSFLVTGNFDELRQEVVSFSNGLYASLGLLGLGLLGAIFFQVRYAMRPMAEMQQKLTDIRAGKIEMLHGNFPTEMQPVADEMNLLIQSNFEIIDRARMQVGNLAHALKTPISVLTNEARESPGGLADKVKEQINVMRDQVNLYLDRARRAARAQTIGAATDVEPVLQSLARTLQRINSEKGVVVAVTCAPGLKFRGERQDLEEIVGNLMDNACKWSKGRVEARGTLLTQAGDDGRPRLLIEVDDDGPGVPPEKRAIALKRGQRLDEAKPGSGLGLNIVTETAAMYGGKVELDKADLGGLRVKLVLPGIG
jgi:signal transduction histidine kinase